MCVPSLPMFMYSFSCSSQCYLFSLCSIVDIERPIKLSLKTSFKVKGLFYSVTIFYHSHAWCLFHCVLWYVLCSGAHGVITIHYTITLYISPCAVVHHGIICISPIYCGIYSCTSGSCWQPSSWWRACSRTTRRTRVLASWNHSRTLYLRLADEEEEERWESLLRGMMLLLVVVALYS